jgi:thioredoxin reductase (NADPH)
MNTPKDTRAFPRLDEEEMLLFGKMASVQDYQDGDVIFEAGKSDIDFFLVESGSMEIQNPTDGNKVIVVHEPGEFSGDIDVLTRRPVIVTAIARGPTRLLRVPGSEMPKLLNNIPKISEKLMTAFQVRRELLQAAGVVGIKVIGPGRCPHTNAVREFLYKNFVPFTWYDPERHEAKQVLAEAQKQALAAATSSHRMPVVDCGGGVILSGPSLQKLAECAKVWHGCPVDHYHLAVIGAGPAGIAAAVYAASEGLKTVVLDRLGPGGQAAASSRIENFIGFPAGLTGADLAMRGVLQMLKFGAKMVAPVNVHHLESPASPGDPVLLHLDCGAILQADMVLIATGVTWRRLDVPGAERFERAGIYYACTQVESRMHEGKSVAVVGGGNSAGQAAMFLAEYCACTVHLLVRSDLSSMSEYLSDRVRATKNIQIHAGVEVAEVFGTSQIDAVDVRHRDDGHRSRLACSAIFVFIGAEPHGDWIPDSVARDENGYLLTGTEAYNSGQWPLLDRIPCPLETTLPRVMAAGDVRSGSTKRVGFAVGDGSLAVTCTHHLRMLGEAVSNGAQAVAVAR